MTILKEISLDNSVKSAMPINGICIIFCHGQLVKVYDIFPEYGEPHYPLGLFLAVEKLQGQGIDKNRAKHIEKIIKTCLFASEKAFLKCSISAFVYRWTQRDLRVNGIKQNECEIITNLFKEYGYSLEKSVSPENKNTTQN